ncbi:MAG TPA: sulfatase [Candidatus Mailhella merdigallinarum]|uniref:Sulfatase n=1 Tax=Candidatus Mailhella merdigallinarum TaxID=2838658 RepID=A0A9D2HCR6_9BACT|nr:MAG: sulfatase [Desulfovibrionaceae bacterium]HJA07660.1 sulfatase [Candidatus Mailhella merdigallinarum]
MEVKNAIVVMFDSLQYNYLHCNGNPWIKTPNFDRFARESVVFDNCYIEGVPTVPCRRAMHTGRYTLPVKGWSALDMDDTTIADLCWGTGIDTAMVFDAAPNRLPKFGYTRGFDKVYFLHGHEIDHEFYAKDPLYHLNPEDYNEEHALEAMDKLLGCNMRDPTLQETACYLRQRQYWKSEEDQNCYKLMREAVNYLERVDRNHPFYLWIDCFDPHEPWDPPSVYDPDMKCPYDPDFKGKDQFLPIMGPVEGIYTEEELHHVRMLYAEKVTMVDRQFGYLLDQLRRLGLERDTLVLVVSDHGEPMGNGKHGHGIMRKCRPWPYEELVHAVMMLRAPGLPAGKRIKSFVQSVDVAPTVCEWLGIGVHPDMQGKSLLALARGEVDKVRDFAVAGYYRYSWSIITDEWSYIHWLKDDEKSVAESMFEIYGKGTLASSSHLADNPLAKAGPQMNAEQRKAKNTAATGYGEGVAALDGEDQWTCTPGSIAEVPARDELYSRIDDIDQLNNVASRHPEVAAELLKKLRLFMSELRAS